MAFHYDIFETPLGWIGALASVTGLRRTTLPQSSPDECIGVLGQEVGLATVSPERFDELKTRLVSYLSGRPVAFEAEPLDVGDAPAFHRAAWAICRSIPPGETRSYKWLAVMAGRPGAPRAAGQAMARNRLPIVVPCHRVIASDGSLGGFGRASRQLDLKRRLLNLEVGVG